MNEHEKSMHSKKRITDEILYQIGKSVLIVFVIVVIVVTAMAWRIIVVSQKSELTLESKSASNQLTGFFEKYTKATGQLAVNPEIIDVMSNTKKGDDILKAEKMETVRNNLLEIANTDKENILSVWIADIDASVLTQSDGFTTDDSWDVTTREWFECTKTGEITLTEPYVDSASGKMILSTVAPVYEESGSKVIGAVGIDILLDHMTEIMSEYKIGKNGYVLLLSPSGIVTYHPQEDMIEKNIADIDISQNIKDSVKTDEQEFVKYKVDGTTKYGYIGKVSDTGYTIISNMPFVEYYTTLFLVVVGLIVIFVIGTVLIVFSIKKSAASLTKPILELNQTAQQLAAGDLDVQLNITAEDEIGELGQSIGNTVSRLKEYIAYIDETAEVLAQIADGKLSIHLKYDYVGEFQKIKSALINISDSMSGVMKGINLSSGQVSTGASELADASEMLAEGAETQAAAVEELVATTTSVAEQVDESRKDAELSADATRQVTVMMEQNQNKMEMLMTAVGKIHETSQQVVGIIQTIEEIAEQTNLLSLNASIEAARAGEAGKGFAVVADEIGKLALESSKAANMTRELIGVSMEEINTGSNIATDVMTSLQESVKAVDNVNNLIKKTAESAALQAENVNQIRQGIEEIAQKVQDNSATAEETSATSEELASQAELLNEMVKKFEVNA